MDVQGSGQSDTEIKVRSAVHLTQHEGNRNNHTEPQGERVRRGEGGHQVRAVRLITTQVSLMTLITPEVRDQRADSRVGFHTNIKTTDSLQTGLDSHKISLIFQWTVGEPSGQTWHDMTVTRRQGGGGGL